MGSASSKPPHSGRDTPAYSGDPVIGLSPYKTTPYDFTAESERPFTHPALRRDTRDPFADPACELVGVMPMTPSPVHRTTAHPERTPVGFDGTADEERDVEAAPVPATDGPGDTTTPKKTKKMSDRKKYWLSITLTLLVFAAIYPIIYGSVYASYTKHWHKYQRGIRKWEYSQEYMTLSPLSNRTTANPLEPVVSVKFADRRREDCQLVRGKKHKVAPADRGGVLVHANVAFWCNGPLVMKNAEENGFKDGVFDRVALGQAMAFNYLDDVDW